MCPPDVLRYSVVILLITTMEVQTSMVASTQTPVQAAAPDFGAIKQRQQQTWSSGDFDKVAVLIMIDQRASLRGRRPAPRPGGARCSLRQR